MQCVSIAVLNKDKKRLISQLQKYGVVELKRSTPQSGFETHDVSAQRLVFERMVQTARQALGVINTFAPHKGKMLDFLNGRREITLDEYYEQSKDAKDTIHVCYDIVALDKQLGECKSEISRLKIAVDQQMSWQSLDVPTGFAGTKTTAAFIGSLNKEYLESEIIEMISAAGFEGDYAMELVSTAHMQTNIFAVCPKKDEKAFDSALRKIGFSYISGADTKNTPLESAEIMNERRFALEKDCEIIKSLISDFAKKREKIEFFIDYYSMRVERYKVYGELLSSNHVTLINGYIPQPQAQDFTEKIERNFSAAVEIFEPDEDDDTPVLLKNNKFNAPCESTVTMFSPPGKNDVDPTSAMAFFFYLFFGMMLSDAGYGLLITLATAFVLKKFNLERSMRNSMQMFFYCGISTMFWGVLFGGFFGDLIPKIAQVYFNKTITMPALLNPIDDALTLLVLGLGLGIVHILVGMGIAFYNLCRQGHVLDAIFDVGFWIVAIIGMVAAVAGMFSGISMLGTVGIVILCAGLAGLVLTQGRKKKGFGKVVSGISSLYDVTSYASDILSYCRLMALGLATGVFAQVINQLGMNKGVFGFIGFIVIFVIGNLISFGMNALGAYVHTIRLQYVEFFSKFYEGGGRMFEPFESKTEFIRFKKTADK